MFHITINTAGLVLADAKNPLQKKEDERPKNRYVIVPILNGHYAKNLHSGAPIQDFLKKLGDDLGRTACVILPSDGQEDDLLCQVRGWDWPKKHSSIPEDVPSLLIIPWVGHFEDCLMEFQPSKNELISISLGDT